jgi:hypothetical protein
MNPEMQMNRDTLLAGTAAAAALLVEHYAFRQHEQTIAPPLTYVVGTATLGLAYTWCCFRQQRPDLALAFWQVAGLGGAAVVAAYAWDARRMQEDT